MKLTKSMVLEVLRECEWAGRYGYYGDERACPVCEDAEPHHEPDCALAEMIRRVEGKAEPTVFQLLEQLAEKEMQLCKNQSTILAPGAGWLKNLPPIPKMRMILSMGM